MCEFFGDMDNFKYFVCYIDENKKDRKLESNSKSAIEFDLQELHQRHIKDEIEVIDHNLDILGHLKKSKQADEYTWFDMSDLYVY